VSVLNGVTVMVAGAGLAGLTAARDLIALGATVTVVDARDRVGGRVLTVRDGFRDGQHAEGGADLIDGSQEEIQKLASELGLELTRILRSGWGFVRLDGRGRPQIVRRGVSRGWERLAKHVSAFSEPYRLAERRWDSPIVADIARRSVAQWLNAINADDELRETALGLRGFFLGDPDELSLLALVDQFATEDAPVPDKMYRIKGGNDRLATALSAPLGQALKLRTEVVAVSQRGRAVRVSLKNSRQVAQLSCEYVVFALPATVLRRIPITPALPQQQHDAIVRLKYGRATKTLLQFSRRFWRIPGRPRAFGSPLPFGALWEANEEQRGTAGILTFMSGGSASDATREQFNRDGPDSLARSLEWLGVNRAELVASRQVPWDDDPWARGGYAFFDPQFDPSLRSWLSRPAGRLFFAGEHTSNQWQGYMNGAIESGRRAAAEVAAVHALMPAAVTNGART
jgi:monoamine oxidase